MPTVSDNRNRTHAIQQFKKGLKAIDNLSPSDDVGDVRMLGAIANALIYVGDSINEVNSTLKTNNYNIELEGVE